MLRQDRILKSICLAAIILLSCKEGKMDSAIYKTYSEKTVSIAEYNMVFTQINDTVNEWISHNRRYYGAFVMNETLKIDSLLCFNVQGNKMIAAKLTKNDDSGSNSDGLTFFYGVKVKQQWCFFDGAFIVLPREFYQKDTLTPLSFSKLHELAMRHIFNGYLKKKDKGFWGNLFGKKEWEIDDDFFSSLSVQDPSWAIYQAGGGFNRPTEVQFDSLVISLCAKNWQERDIVTEKP